MTTLSPRLCKAARALVGWQQDDLALRSGVSKSTIGAFESKDEPARLTKMNNKALVEALEVAGIAFIEENGNGGPGVRLRSRGGASSPTTPTGPATDAVRAMDAAIETHERTAKTRPLDRKPPRRPSSRPPAVHV